MYNPFKKVTPGSLEAALEACSIANKQGWMFNIEVQFVKSVNYTLEQSL